MAGTFGKIEAQITIPTGGWTATVSGTATIPAGTYYLSSAGSGSNDFLAEVANQFATASGTSCSITASLGEYGTGIVTITFGASRAITWVSTDLRDILGFAGNSSSATVHTGTKHARGIWMPSCPYSAQHGVSTSWPGHVESDLRVVENAAGYVWAHQGQYKRVLDSLAWNAVRKSRVHVADESTVGESLEQFWLDGIFGVAAWGTPAGPIRFYPDASVDGTYVTYKVAGGAIYRPENVFENYSGTWAIKMPRLVKVPA